MRAAVLRHFVVTDGISDKRHLLRCQTIFLENCTAYVYFFSRRSIGSFEEIGETAAFNDFFQFDLRRTGCDIQIIIGVMFGDELESSWDVRDFDDLFHAELRKFLTEPFQFGRSRRPIEKIFADDLELIIAGHSGVVGMEIGNSPSNLIGLVPKKMAERLTFDIDGIDNDTVEVKNNGSDHTALRFQSIQPGVSANS